VSHEHSHDHETGGGDAHGHEVTDFGRAFVIGITLNFAFVIVEVVYGLLAHSMALVADAGHNLSDVLGLVLSLGAAMLAKRRATSRHTYGFRRSTILASLTNAVVLLFVTGGIAWESLQRFVHPETVGGLTVIVVALVGVVINGFSALLFAAGRKGDLNVRSAFLHLASDAGLALGVAVAGGVMLVTGWHWLDPAVSLALSLFILWSTWSLLRSSVNLVMDAVPEGIAPEKVRAHLVSLPDVLEVHDLHIWALSTTENALTAHLTMVGGACDPAFLTRVCKQLRDTFGIHHSTLQVEAPEAPEACQLASKEMSRRGP
jgi:cobalt-zinc-cadmium efflux system protein